MPISKEEGGHLARLALKEDEAEKGLDHEDALATHRPGKMEHSESVRSSDHCGRCVRCAFFRRDPYSGSHAA